MFLYANIEPRAAGQQQLGVACRPGCPYDAAGVRPRSHVGQKSSWRTASPSKALQSDLWPRSGSVRGTIVLRSIMPKSRLDLLDEHGGSSREVLRWRIDLKLALASPASPAKVGGGDVCLCDSLCC